MVYHVLYFIVLFLPTCLRPQGMPDFDANRAFAFLEAQCALGPRNPGSQGHIECLEFIQNVVSPLADTVILQPFPYTDPYSGKMLQLTNLIAQFRPEKKERFWVAAHWDTRPWADRDRVVKNRSQPILGANDGASGVAVLLELAHHLAESVPPVGVDLVFLDGEDLGKQGDLDHYFNGSRYLAQHIPTRIPRYCILLDMIGDKELELPIEGNSRLQAPDLVKELWDLAAVLGLDAFQPRVEYSVEDDHVPLYQVGGIPSIDIIDFRYPNRSTNYWHTLADTPDKCSRESLETVGTLILHHIYGNMDKR